MPRSKLKPRRNLLFRTSRSLSLAGISFLGVTLTLLIVIIMFPYVPEPETGIFVHTITYSEVARESLYADAILRVVPRGEMLRPPSPTERFPRLTFIIEDRPLSFEQLEGYLKTFWERLKKRRRLVYEYDAWRVPTRDGWLRPTKVLVLIEKEAIGYLDHGDFVAICDMLKQANFGKIVVVVMDSAQASERPPALPFVNQVREWDDWIL